MTCRRPEKKRKGQRGQKKTGRGGRSRSHEAGELTIRKWTFLGVRGGIRNLVRWGHALVKWGTGWKAGWFRARAELGGCWGYHGGGRK